MTAHAQRARIDNDPPAMGLATWLRIVGSLLVLTLLQWQELARQRRRLLAMDDRMLKDIGISRADAWQEGTRPFWDTRDIGWTRWL